MRSGKAHRRVIKVIKFVKSNKSQNSSNLSNLSKCPESKKTPLPKKISDYAPDTLTVVVLRYVMCCERNPLSDVEVNV